MVDIITIHLLLPELLWPVDYDSIEKTNVRPRFIEKLLSRASRQHTEGLGLEETLFRLFDVSSHNSFDLPTAAVTYLGDGGDPAEYCWAVASPVQFIADRDRLLLVGSEHLNIQYSEAEALIKLFNRHFEEDELTLVYGRSGIWYLRISECPEVRTFSQESVVGHFLDDYLPRGADEQKLLSLLNETQMLFHQSDVNQERTVAGKETISGLWLSGFGRLPKVDARAVPIYSSLPITRGLSDLMNTTHYELGADINDIDLQHEEVFIINSEFMETKKALDLPGWRAALMRLDNNLASLMVDNKKNIELVIYNCMGERYHINKKRLSYAFWKISKNINSFK
ncbi:MAG: hypothetical protein B6D79_06610 [gamma proteobacterium symbiont of Ctena orbiculata]|nr:MAG: hypothetical protein B6D79_06610 [gamma proteobacterium symbiont of Ctena orbiculata]